MKKKRGSGVWYISSVNTVRKIAVAKASGLMLSSTLLFAELPVLVSSSVRGRLTLPRLTSEVRTTKDASPNFAYLVLRNTCRPNVRSPDYLLNLLGTGPRWKRRQQQVWGEKSSWDIFFQVISVEKCLMLNRTNRCLGCVGYVYVGRIYQNRGETLLG